jgi:predicted amidohydrolase
MEIMTSINIALAQFAIQIGAPEANIGTGFHYIDQAIQQGCQLIVLPELWTSGYDLENAESYIDVTQDIIVKLQSLADQRNILIGGSYLTLDQGGHYNTFLLVQPGVKDPLRYNKIHLFRQLDEPKYLMAGSLPVAGDTSIGKVGLAVCYDLRFPEMFRAYGRSRVELVLIAAQWGSERSEHWRTFLRARAIENQFFIAAVNAVGPIREKILAGFSAIVDPWGYVLAEADGTEETLITAEIDLEVIKKASEKVPSREDARNDLYPNWF